MAEAKWDVVGIGNAIVDVLAKADDAFLARHTWSARIDELCRLAGLGPSGGPGRLDADASVRVELPDGVVEQLRRQLAAADLPVFALAQSRPSLDDVYLQATGRTLMDAELAVAGSRDPKAERKASM